MLPSVIVIAAMIQARITALWPSEPAAAGRSGREMTAVRVRRIARKPIALGTQARSAAMTVGDPW